MTGQGSVSFVSARPGMLSQASPQVAGLVAVEVVAPQDTVCGGGLPVAYIEQNRGR